jgi:hypothetical protein
MAHEGEEFVIALPAVMLGAAFLILKWAAGPSNAVVEPPDEHEPAGDPGDDQRQVQVRGERLAEDDHQEGESQDPEDEQAPLHSV